MQYKASRGTPPEDLQFVSTHPAMQARAEFIRVEQPSRTPPAWGFVPRDRQAVPVIHTERGIGNTATFGEHLDDSDVTEAVVLQRARYATLMLLLFHPFTSESDLKGGADTWDPWTCFLHAKATGTLRPMAAAYMKHAQLFHVRFLRNQADLLALPAVQVRAPARTADQFENGAAPHTEHAHDDEAAFDALHAMASSATTDVWTAAFREGVPRQSTDAYADPAATKASVQRNSVFAERQDSALQQRATRDRLLRPGTLTDPLLVASEDVSQHQSNIAKWGAMLRGTARISQPVLSETGSEASSTPDPRAPPDSTSWRTLVSVEIAHCFSNGGFGPPLPVSDTAHLLSINEVGTTYVVVPCWCLRKCCTYPVHRLLPNLP